MTAKKATLKIRLIQQVIIKILTTPPLPHTISYYYVVKSNHLLRYTEKQGIELE
ncbi:hypothetical protein KDW_00430 [Dictyobacter vulcani]|uniref:Uncharacterized protein n=1 Tax=Dictyobacter vulcani TaxID=2607529 RepID=A0A5J4KIA4_9CHLR|nr:hypothetical protein KDW_00430 [Dictyobacter vulcani]